MSLGQLSLAMRVTACLLICLGLTRCTPATGLALLCLVLKERWNRISISTESSLAGMSATLTGCLTVPRPSSLLVVVSMLCVMRWPTWPWWTAMLSLRAPVCWAHLLTSICVRSKVSGRVEASPPMPHTQCQRTVVAGAATAHPCQTTSTNPGGNEWVEGPRWVGEHRVLAPT